MREEITQRSTLLLVFGKKNLLAPRHFLMLKVRYLYEKHQIGIWCIKKDDYDKLLFAL